MTMEQPKQLQLYPGSFNSSKAPESHTPFWPCTVIYYKRYAEARSINNFSWSLRFIRANPLRGPKTWRGWSTPTEKAGSPKQLPTAFPLCQQPSGRTKTYSNPTLTTREYLTCKRLQVIKSFAPSRCINTDLQKAEAFSNHPRECKLCQKAQLAVCEKITLSLCPAVLHRNAVPPGGTEHGFKEHFLRFTPNPQYPLSCHSSSLFPEGAAPRSGRCQAPHAALPRGTFQKAHPAPQHLPPPPADPPPAPGAGSEGGAGPAGSSRAGPCPWRSRLFSAFKTPAMLRETSPSAGKSIVRLFG